MGNNVSGYQAHRSDVASTSQTASARLGGRRVAAGTGSTQSRTRDVEASRPSAELVQKLNKRPYVSTNAPYTSIRLNEQVMIPASSSAASGLRPISCRNFATYVAKATTDEGMPMSQVGTLFRSDQAVSRAFANMTMKEADRIYVDTVKDIGADSKHLITDKQLGQYLSCVAGELDHPDSENGASSARAMLLTESHAMVLEVNRKAKDNDGEYYTAKLYDPSTTASYKRVVRTAPNEFESLDLQAMMVEPRDASHYHGRHTELSMVAACLEEGVAPKMARGQVRANATNMHVAMAYGSTNDVNAILTAAQEQPTLSSQRHGRYQKHPMLDLLTAKNSQGLPGLAVALLTGQAETVSTVVGFVLNSSFSDVEKTSLLTAYSHDTPGFLNACASGHSDTVENFSLQVLESELGLRSKIELLISRNGFGTTGLGMACLRGHHETVASFTQAVLGSYLEDNIKVGFLRSIVNEKSVRSPSLTFAFRAGHVEVIQEFVQNVLNSKLESSAKLDLLNAADQAGDPAINKALVRNRFEAVQKFASLVIDSDLDDAQKVGLLEAKNVSTQADLKSTIQHRFPTEAFAAYCTLIEHSELDDNCKNHLLGSSRLPPG